EQIEKAIEAAPAKIRPRWYVRVSDLYGFFEDRAASERAILSALLAGAAARAAGGGVADDPSIDALERLHPVNTADGAAACFRILEEAMRRAKTPSSATDPALLAALGRIEAVRLGRPREGIGKIREAIRVDPARVESYAVLCEVYASLGST